MDSNELQSNLAKIRELTETVVPLVNIAKLLEDSVSYTASRGNIIGHGLLNVKQLAIQLAVMGAETNMVCHYHDEYEIIILYEGDFSLSVEGEDVFAELGVPLIVKPMTPHIAKSVHGCKLIAMTIPASPAYPNSKKPRDGE